MSHTNVEHLHTGCAVRIRRAQLLGKEPTTWKNDATLIRFEHDHLLTDSNRRGVTVYRCIVRFEGTPTSQDVRAYGSRRCRQASVLPLMLETI